MLDDVYHCRGEHAVAAGTIFAVFLGAKRIQSTFKEALPFPSNAKLKGGDCLPQTNSDTIHLTSRINNIHKNQNDNVQASGLSQP